MLQLSHAPFWGEKLQEPHFFKPEKLAKFNRHWEHKKGLEALKMKQALLYGENPTPQQREVIKNELGSFVDACYAYEQEFKYNDVYVTDHKKVDAKVITNGENEDQDLFDYEQAVDAYNAEVPDV